MHVSIKCIAMLAGLMPLAACAGDNLGLASVNQPVVAGNSASVPGCPNWSVPANELSASSDTNYGCASNGNLAAMIADPADLIHGRAYTGTDIEVSTRAVRAWRETPPTGKGEIEKVTSKGGN